MAVDFYQGAQATDSAAASIDAQAVGAASDLRILGFSCKETSGSAAAAFTIRNGTTDSAPAIVFVDLAAGESTRDWFGECGIQCPSGVFIDRDSGTSEVVVWTKQA